MKYIGLTQTTIPGGIYCTNKLARQQRRTSELRSQTPGSRSLSQLAWAVPLTAQRLFVDLGIYYRESVLRNSI